MDLDRLHHNAGVIAAAAGAPLMPVIKANAYGHGAIPIARELARRKDTAALCVWSLDEAEILRKAGIKGRALVLGGAWPWEGKRAAGLGVEMVVSSADQAKAVASGAGRSAPAVVHFKINTGMNRFGADPQAAFDEFAAISKMKNLRLAGVMTHLASAGGGKGKTLRQIAVFEEVLGALRSAGYSIPPRHAANTAAIFLHPEARFDLVRPGIGLYGIAEFPGPDPELLPVLSLKAVALSVREVAKGETVSYDGMWKSPGERRVAALSLGYADGFSRALSGRAHAIINGRKIPQIGAICMDSSMFDVTGADVSPGDVATLIGSEGSLSIGVGALAEASGTISYEILCRIGPRVRRIYIRRGKIIRKADFPAF